MTKNNSSDGSDGEAEENLEEQMHKLSPEMKAIQVSSRSHHAVRPY